MAYFLDLDGTLAEIAATPGAASVPKTTLAALRRLADATGGAVAVVSGRSIAAADTLLSPLSLPVAGLHGAERRDAAGRDSRASVDQAMLTAMEESLAPALEAHPALLLERKPTGFALHYRAEPALGPLARRLMTQAAAPYDEVFALQPGKMVLEVKPRGIDKGQAIAAFMAEPPFAGRPPVFAGDDTTDEAGFALVNAHGGLSIKIGPGATAATHRLPSVAALAAWLSDLEEKAA